VAGAGTGEQDAVATTDGCDGEAVYGRYDDGQVYVALPDDVEPPVPDDLRDHLHRVERDVADVSGGDITAGVLMALLEETPSDDDGEDGDDGIDADGDGHGEDDGVEGEAP